MKRYVLLAVLVLSAGLLGATLGFRATEQPILIQQSVIGKVNQPNYAGMQAVCVRIDVGYGNGSGVLVTRRVGDANRAFVWTAGHVAAELRNPDGTFRNAIIFQEQRENGRLVGTTKAIAKVIAYSDADVGDDLALLEIQEDNPTTGSTIFDLRDDYLPVGTELVHVGCTLGLYNSVSLGIISQTDRDLLGIGMTFDQTSCAGYPGSSGGGVFLAKSGECVGLLVRGAGPGLNFIVPVRRMLVWAKQEGIEWALNPSIPVPLARAPTVLERVPAK